MRIAIVSDKCWPEFVGGYERRVADLARGLAAHHEVCVLTSTSEPTKVGGVELRRVAPALINKDHGADRSWVQTSLFTGALRFASLNAWRPDLLIIEAIPYLHLRWAFRLARSSGAKCALDVSEAWWGYRPDSDRLGKLQSVAVRRLLKDALPRADLVIAVSRATATSLVTNYRVPPDRLEIIPNSIDISAIRNPFAYSSSLGTTQSEYDLITVGRLVAAKRHADIVEAAAILRRRYRWRGRALILGSGRQRLPLLSLIRERGLEDIVELKSGVSESEKEGLLARSRIFVLPSEKEGFSFAALEALARGLPVLAARPGHDEVFGASEMVEDGSNGWLYPVGQPSKLAGLVNDALRNQSFSSFRRRARATAEQFDFPIIAERFERILRIRFPQ
jgi:glycosyltransferase involved in cell wall biosynthesis